jgi:spoIIIJ-associated protein
MSQEKTTLEIIAPSVEEAINRGLEQLGLPLESVVVDVLDNGSRGLLGIGGRHSRVRLSIKTVEPEPGIVDVESESEFESPAVANEPVTVKQVAEADLSDDESKALKVTQDTVIELLKRMHIQAEVTSCLIEPVDENDERLVMVDIQGKDLSILIGRRSETLNALQYITSLIVSKELNRWVPMMIDVQGYRSRRERQLRQLGRRMADQAVQTGKRQVLEPMPANERRVIHLELRDHQQVTTESTGDEPYRKVTIVPKK